MKTNVIAFPVKAKKSRKNSKKDIPHNVIEFPNVMTLTRLVRMSQQIREANK
jgi:hypothetical protein